MGGFAEVLEKFGGPYEAYAATEKELSKRLSAYSPAIAGLLNKDLSEAHRIYDFCSSHGISILTYGDIAYPARLRTIQNPPLLLYYVGELPSFNRRLCIGVVGTRKMSEYGKRMAYKISYELASAGVVVVSGMALGCDGIAAAGAIGANGATVAILGSGIDMIYPKEHSALMEEIARHGVVMTEYPPGTPPQGKNFPIRNRIISGLSEGAVAVEGDAKSGAMLTIAHAVKQGRKVFAVPGNVGEVSASGTNELIRTGATVALSAGDILESFEVTNKDLIDLEGYHRSIMHSEPDEGLIFRLGVAARPPHGVKKTFEREAPEGGEPHFDKSATSIRTVTKRKKETTTSFEQARERIEQKASRSGDGSPEVLSSLSERERRIFTEMPIDRAISIDRLGALGFSVGDIMTAMTILEIRGLVTSLPGGLYLKK